MIEYYRTSDNKITKIKGFEKECWIYVAEPTDDEISLLRDDYNIRGDFICSCLDDEESSRVETEGEQTLIIFDTPFKDNDSGNHIYYAVPVGIIITENNTITITPKINGVLEDFKNNKINKQLTENKTQVILSMLLAFADQFLEYLREIDNMSNEFEQQLRKSMKNRELIQLLDVQKSLVYFSAALKSDKLTLEKLISGRYLSLYEIDQDLLKDVLVEMKQASDMTELYLEILSGTMAGFASVISNNLNIVMKVLASMTIVLSMPTIIFSFYGMNVNLPFADSHIFPAILSGALMFVLGFFLWRKNML